VDALVESMILFAIGLAAIITIGCTLALIHDLTEEWRQ